MQIMFWMRKDVRPKFGNRLKKAIQAPDSYRLLSQDALEREKTGAAPAPVTSDMSA